MRFRTLSVSKSCCLEVSLAHIVINVVFLRVVVFIFCCLDYFTVRLFFKSWHCHVVINFRFEFASSTTHRLLFDRLVSADDHVVDCRSFICGWSCVHLASALLELVGALLADLAHQAQLPADMWNRFSFAFVIANCEAAPRVPTGRLMATRRRMIDISLIKLQLPA